MRYFFCFLFPPAAILSTGKIGAFILNIFLTLFFWVPGIIHSILVVNNYYDDKRNRRLIRATRRRYNY
ncbi:hypothetical protein BH09BAC6_BH09BAC6_02090 [soil metagenome]|jgi:uncharacterized membrane protein YqaE (UPF0057 family)